MAEQHSSTSPEVVYDPETEAEVVHCNQVSLCIERDTGGGCLVLGNRLYDLPSMDTIRDLALLLALPRVQELLSLV